MHAMKTNATRLNMHALSVVQYPNDSEYKYGERYNGWLVKPRPRHRAIGSVESMIRVKVCKSMRFAYEFYRRTRCGDFTAADTSCTQYRESPASFGEAAVMRFVCDERDRGCDEGGKRKKSGVLSN